MRPGFEVFCRLWFLGDVCVAQASTIKTEAPLPCVVCSVAVLAVAERGRRGATAGGLVAAGGAGEGEACHGQGRWGGSAYLAVTAGANRRWVKRAVGVQGTEPTVVTLSVVATRVAWSVAFRARGES